MLNKKWKIKGRSRDRGGVCVPLALARSKLGRHGPNIPWLSSKDKIAAKRSGKAQNAPLQRDELTHSPLAGLWPTFSTVLQAKLVTHTHLQPFHKNVHEWDMQMVVGFMAHVAPICAPHVSMLMTE